MKQTISFQNVLLTGSEILGVVNAVADADTPVVLSTIPGGVSSSVSGDIALGELGVGIVSQILQAIAAAHAAKAAK